MAQLIGPDGLEADAVVPQCLDNQYVSDQVFSDMINRGVDYQDHKVVEARERDFRTEFIRSLIYSSQVVIQRANLKNSEFLYKNYQPENVADLQAFAALMRSNAIIPYLYAESSLTDEQQFSTRDEGNDAIRALLQETGSDVRCVRLAVDDAVNSQAADIMATNFGVGVTRLNHLNSLQRNAMASELFGDPGQLQQEGRWQKFEEAVDDLADFAFTKARVLRQDNLKITRQHVYQDCFAAGESDRERAENVALGRFRKPGASTPFLLELKKYVDLVYNVNLPDQLKRYTFTPVNMPSRMALQDAPGEGFKHEQITSVISDETLEWIRRSFMARTQSAMSLPLLSELSVADVLAVRDLPDWKSFKDAQQQILRNPLQCSDNIEAFQEAFDHFQTAFSDWYYRTHKWNTTISRYCGFVTFALSIAGVLVVAGSDLGSLLHDPQLEAMAHDGLIFAIPEMANKIIPARVKGYAAKLMVGVYDIGRRRLDAERSYTIELMQTNEELMREEVLELLNSVHKAESALPRASGTIADQGIK